MQNKNWAYTYCAYYISQDLKTIPSKLCYSFSAAKTYYLLRVCSEQYEQKVNGLRLEANTCQSQRSEFDTYANVENQKQCVISLVVMVTSQQARTEAQCSTNCNWVTCHVSQTLLAVSCVFVPLRGGVMHILCGHFLLLCLETLGLRMFALRHFPGNTVNDCIN